MNRYLHEPIAVKWLLSDDHLCFWPRLWKVLCHAFLHSNGSHNDLGGFVKSFQLDCSRIPKIIMVSKTSLYISANTMFLSSQSIALDAQLWPAQTTGLSLGCSIVVAWTSNEETDTQQLIEDAVYRSSWLILKKPLLNNKGHLYKW